MVCSGTWNAAGFRKHNYCIRSDDKTRTQALAALHSADFDYERPMADRNRRELAARQSLLICPGCEGDIATLTTDAIKIDLRVGGLGDAKALLDPSCEGW